MSNVGIRILGFIAFSLGFVHARYTSNMAACHDNDVNDVTAPNVLLL